MEEISDRVVLNIHFGWFGLIGIPIVGTIVGKIHNNIEELRIHRLYSENNISVMDKDNDELCINISNNDTINVKNVFSLIMAISLLLFIRGYFADMVQKLVWIMLMVIFLSTFVIEKGANCNEI